MEKKFSGKTALITGAAAGLGRAAALVFADKGADVILLDTAGERLKTVEGECEAMSVRAKGFNCDISDEERVKAIVAEAEKAFGKIDILINNAAIWRCWSTFLDTPTEEWKKYFDINVMGTVYVTKAVLAGMVDRGYGKIVNVASVAGHYGNAMMAHYSATKGAIIAFTSALAKEVADKGINVNCISPGTVSREDGSGSIDAWQENKLNTLKRTGTGRENAELIAYLCTDEARYIVGQNILIDGGRRSI